MELKSRCSPHYRASMPNPVFVNSTGWLPWFRGRKQSLPATTASMAKAAKEPTQAPFSSRRTGGSTANRSRATNGPCNANRPANGRRAANGPGNTNGPARRDRHLAAGANIPRVANATNPTTAIAVDIGLAAVGHHRNTGDFGSHRCGATGLRAGDRSAGRGAGLATAAVAGTGQGRGKSHKNNGKQGTDPVHVRRLLIQNHFNKNGQTSAAFFDPLPDPALLPACWKSKPALAIWAM